MRFSVRLSTVFAVALAVALAFWLAAPVLWQPALASREVTIDGCIADRTLTAALMNTGDNIYFELGLRSVLDTSYSLAVDNCYTINGQDHGTEAGINRQFPQAGWYVEAEVITDTGDHINRSRRITDA